MSPTPSPSASQPYSLLILPGDGIGPEVMAEVRKVIAWFGKRRGLLFDVDEDLVGGAAYKAVGHPLPPETLVIDEVEALWAAIDRDDDWSPLLRKIDSIREMGRFQACLGLPRRPGHLPLGADPAA